MLRGNLPVKVDDRGRLKLPQPFKSIIVEQFGTALFVTSLNGESVRIYPLPIWVDIEKKLGKMPSTHPARIKFLSRANFHGQSTELDTQDRVLIHPRLRESAAMVGEVDVFGQYDYLEAWNHERYASKLKQDPLTDTDLEALAGYGI